jgi:hypothetical protein
LYFKLVCNSVCFLKFVLHEINSKMIKSIMVVLTEREKTGMTDADMDVGYCWSPDGRVGERKMM